MGHEVLKKNCERRYIFLQNSNADTRYDRREATNVVRVK